MNVFEAIVKALEKWNEKTGNQLENGDKFVTVFSDCTLVVSMEDGNMKTDFNLGKPVFVNENVFGTPKQRNRYQIKRNLPKRI